ncbi:ComEA family DNA-binding protein [Collinsella sp. An2]|uniref:ComEA family DNA-binding protein n=1 Tax=Collinsella sp. An2 TaxID=1965585 RepID=UPI000B38E4A4|nr:ComEA family DNA-binding protein [Collinsella sp. An2]OUP07834.1 hypothetical protein B5F33_08235 [Collinsella sp. An2]
MAQIQHDGSKSEKVCLARALRQRPALAAAVVLVVLACLASVLLGGVAATGEQVFIDRAETTDIAQEDEADDAAPTGDSEGDRATSPEAAEAPAQDTIVVDVTGAVATPSVVTLPAGSRVEDALRAAGGVTEDAELAALNRAAPLTDGQKVHVPRVGEAVTSSGGAASPGEVTSSGASPAGASSGLVNINSADATALDALPGVGPATAQAIIEDREANGPFASIEDIMRVSGIGEKKFANLKDLICV